MKAEWECFADRWGNVAWAYTVLHRAGDPDYRIWVPFWFDEWPA